MNFNRWAKEQQKVAKKEALKIKHIPGPHVTEERSRLLGDEKIRFEGERQTIVNMPHVKGMEFDNNRIQQPLFCIKLHSYTCLPFPYILDLRHEIANIPPEGLLSWEEVRADYLLREAFGELSNTSAQADATIHEQKHINPHFRLLGDRGGEWTLSFRRAALICLRHRIQRDARTGRIQQGLAKVLFEKSRDKIIEQPITVAAADKIISDLRATPFRSLVHFATIVQFARGDQSIEHIKACEVEEFEARNTTPSGATITVTSADVLRAMRVNQIETIILDDIDNDPT